MIVTPATIEEARYVASTIRNADREECLALTGLPPELVLPGYIRPGNYVNTLRSKDDTILGMGGIVPVPTVEGVANVWFVSTEHILTHTVEFLREGRAYIDAINQDFPVITNLVDARNTLHHRWLKWHGFVFLRKVEKWGAQSLPFIEFVRHESACA